MGMFHNLSMCYEMEMVSFQEESTFCEGFVSLCSRVIEARTHLEAIYFSSSSPVWYHVNSLQPTVIISHPFKCKS